jgi:hypothetical protein
MTSRRVDIVAILFGTQAQSVLLWLGIGVGSLAILTLLPALTLAALLRRIARPAGAAADDALPPGWGRVIPIAHSGPLRLEPEHDRSERAS